MFLHELASRYFGFEARLSIALLNSVASSWLLFKCRNLCPGRDRLTPALLVTLGNLVTPNLFNSCNELITMSLLSLNTLWLSSFKVVSLYYKQMCCSHHTLSGSWLGAKPRTPRHQPRLHIPPVRRCHESPDHPNHPRCRRTCCRSTCHW